MFYGMGDDILDTIFSTTASGVKPNVIEDEETWRALPPSAPLVPTAQPFSSVMSEAKGTAPAIHQNELMPFIEKPLIPLSQIYNRPPGTTPTGLPASNFKAVADTASAITEKEQKDPAYNGSPKNKSDWAKWVALAVGVLSTGAIAATVARSDSKKPAAKKTKITPQMIEQAKQQNTRSGVPQWLPVAVIALAVLGVAGMGIAGAMKKKKRR